MKRILPILLALVLLCGCGKTVTSNTTPTTTPETTKPTETVSAAAPNFTMYTLEGEKVSLDDFKGKPIVLNFWASWCGPCKNEMPELEAAYKEYGERIHFLMVNLTDGVDDTVEKASTYIAQQGYTFPVYYDKDLSGATAYGVSSIPFTLFINAEGDIVAYYTGSMNKQILQSGIGMLMPETK